MSYLSLSLLPTPLPHNTFNFVFSLLVPVASVSPGQGREDAGTRWPGVQAAWTCRLGLTEAELVQ